MTTTLPTSKLTLNRHETAAAIGISVRSLDALTHPKGPIPCLRLGSRVLFSVDSLRQFIANQERRAECDRQSTASAPEAAG